MRRSSLLNLRTQYKRLQFEPHAYVLANFILRLLEEVLTLDQHLSDQARAAVETGPGHPSSSPIGCLPGNML